MADSKMSRRPRRYLTDDRQGCNPGDLATILPEAVSTCSPGIS